MHSRRLIAVLVLLLTALVLSPASAQVQDYRDLRFPPLPRFDIPNPEVFTLPNGMRVYLMEDNELPLVQVTARIRTGSNYEPADKIGLAYLMGVVQRSGGSESMTGDQLDDFLSARAATVETAIGEDSGSAAMDCLKEDFDEVFRIFSDVLRHPAFPQDKLELAKITLTTSIARRNDDVGEITSREIQRLVYGPDSPLARVPEYHTVKAVQREDLIDWHKRFYHPNNIILGVVGDFKAQEMRKKIETVFGPWQKGPSVELPPVEYRKSPVPGFYYIEKQDVNQANIVMGHLGIERKNPDFYAAQVMNEILGGGFASRMFSNVRSRQGLAYSVYGGLGSDFNHPGLFRAGLQTRLENTTKAIQAVKTEVKNMIEVPPSDAELKRAKDSILNSFIFNYDSREKILGQQITYAYYGLPPDYLDQYRANIEKVTRQDVSRVASKYILPDQLAVLVVGNASGFGQPLTNLGPVKTIDITIPPPAQESRQIPNSAAATERGRQIWQLVAKTMGGESLKKAEAIHSETRIALSVGGQSMAMEQAVTIVFPDKIRTSISLPVGEQILTFNGQKAWATMNGKLQQLPAAVVQEQRSDMNRNLVHLLRNYDDSALEVSAGSPETINGSQHEVIAVVFRGSESRLWVSPDGKVVKQSYEGKNPVTGAPGVVEQQFTDFRTESGLLIAHKQVRLVDGEQILTATLERFELNPKIDPKLFDKPAE